MRRLLTGRLDTRSASAHLGSRLVLGASLLLVLPLAMNLASCSSQPPEEPALGVAYVGPSTLILRTDLTVRSAERIVVSHGERLEILETRRRFVRVRAPEGVQGWTDSNMLLSSGQMEDLGRLGEVAKALPSQGRATVFDQLNVHTESNRLSPSFFQIAEDGSVDVIAHRVAPRNQTPTRLVLREAAPARASKKRKRGPEKEAPLIAPPGPPRPASNWQDLSRPRAPDLPGYKPPPPPAPAPTDDWSLVRAADGRVGWVLSRMLFMAVPDEVAQYAEGHQITAYLALDNFSINGENKPTWLWTTASPGFHDGEFDSFRVFVWSTRRHRYETGHIERNLIGFYPIERVEIPGEKDRGFSLILTEKDGQISKRTYSFSDRRVKMISKAPYQPLAWPSGDETPASDAGQSPGPREGWWRRLTSWVRAPR